MCGIAGVWQATGSAEATNDLNARMVASLVRRGPDDAGVFCAGSVAIGMRRLSIIDVVGGHQPIASEDGSVTLVCNGELYNHQTIRQRLEAAGHRFRTQSDVEVLLHLYEEHGLSLLDDVQGMFAFALWDARARRLVVGRDRLGIKPLYYAHQDGRFLFGSELKALLAVPGMSREIDREALDRYLTLGYVPAPLTIYRDVRKLLPGHLAIRDDQGLTLQRYWSPERAIDTTITEADAEREVERLLQGAVASHLMSEVPLGAFLSGGVDSSLIVAMMARAAGSQPVRTFTIGYRGSIGAFLDERGIAARTSRALGAEHHEFEVSPDIDAVLDEAALAFDEPFADDSVIPSYYISQRAREHVTVALTGLGGDELFGGYERHLGVALSEKFDRRVPSPVRAAMRMVADRVPERADGHYTVNHAKRFLRASGLPLAERYLSYLTVFPTALRDSLVRPGWRANTAFHLGTGATPSQDALSWALTRDLELYLPDDILTLTDRLSMWHSLELRVPFLDHPLVEFCQTLPSHFKIRGRQKKHLLRRIAARWVPQDVMQQRKQGFASPLAAWLRSDLRDYFSRTLAPERLEAHGAFEPGVVASMIERHLNREELYDKQLFALLMFQKWYERVHAPATGDTRR